jgi:hypothetical protein
MSGILYVSALIFDLLLASRLLHPLLLPRLARASRGALPTQRRARLRVIVFSSPSHSSDIKARAAMDGGAPLG